MATIAWTCNPSFIVTSSGQEREPSKAFSMLSHCTGGRSNEAAIAAVHESLPGTLRHLVRCSDMSEVGGRPEVTGRLSKRRETRHVLGWVNCDDASSSRYSAARSSPSPSRFQSTEMRHSLGTATMINRRRLVALAATSVLAPAVIRPVFARSSKRFW
jgi:hypothetical protein